MGTVNCSEMSSNHAQMYVTFNCFKLPLFMPSYRVYHLYSKCIFPASMYLVFSLLYNFVQRGYTLYYKTSGIIHKFQLPEFILGHYIHVCGHYKWIALFYVNSSWQSCFWIAKYICTCVVNYVHSWINVSVVISFTFCSYKVP